MLPDLRKTKKNIRKLKVISTFISIEYLLWMIDRVEMHIDNIRYTLQLTVRDSDFHFVSRDKKMCYALYYELTSLDGVSAPSDKLYR